MTALAPLDRPLRVVVADDDALQRAVLCAMLRRLGHEPVEAEDGPAALGLVAAGAARVLLCDLRMPGLDGHALTERVRRIPAPRYVHVVMVTGADEGAERRRALAAGVDDFLAKPVEATLLAARMRAVERLVRHEELLVERSDVLEAARRVIDGDLRDAARAQARLLPPPVLELPGARVVSATAASSWVSGDMIGAFALPGGRTGYYAVDVSGHGVRAALTSVAIGHLLTPETFAGAVLDAAGRADPAGLARLLDARFRARDSDDYLTLSCGVLDPAAGTLHHCQAGYPAPLVLPRAGAPRPVGSGGYPVALLDGAAFRTERVPFGPGDTLLVASDGATEAESPDGTPWGAARLAEAAAAALPGGLDALPHAIVRAVALWRHGAPAADDLALLAIQTRRPA